MQLQAALIKQLRLERGWTQQQLADICDVSLRTIQRVEIQGIASLETSKAIAAAFDIQRERLLTQATQELPQAQVVTAAMPWWLLVGVFVAGVMSGALFLSLLR